MNFAIIGCGHIAKKHAEAIQNIENANLRAVCDKITSNMTYYKDTYSAVVYEDLDEMLNDEKIDVVSICTPSGSHAAIAIKVANAKKHVIVEKPMALTLKDADAIIQACEENNVKLAVVHPNRSRPAVREIKSIINENLLGKFSHANATVRWNRNQAYYDQAAWRGSKLMDGGVLMNQAIHDLDLLLWMMGPVDEIQAYTATRFRKIESEDVAVAVLKFKNGALGVIEAATTIYPKNLEESISIFGEYGSVQIGGATANWIKHLDVEALPAEKIKEIIDQVDKEPYGIPGHQVIINDMIHAIKENRKPIVTGYDGRDAIQLVLGICQAAENKNTLKWDNIE